LKEFSDDSTNDGVKLCEKEEWVKVGIFEMTHVVRTEGMPKVSQTLATLYNIA
jgi:hypothetical protein